MCCVRVVGLFASALASTAPAETCTVLPQHGPCLGLPLYGAPRLCLNPFYDIPHPPPTLPEPSAWYTHPLPPPPLTPSPCPLHPRPSHPAGYARALPPARIATGKSLVLAAAAVASLLAAAGAALQQGQPLEGLWEGWRNLGSWAVLAWSAVGPGALAAYLHVKVGGGGGWEGWRAW